MRMHNIYFVLLLSLVFIGCAEEDASDVNQERIQKRYQLIYSQALNNTSAYADFRFGNTYLRLTSPSYVTVNNLSMSYDSNIITDYSRTFNGPLQEALFEYKNNDGEIFRNSVNLPNPISVSNSLNTISKSSVFRFYWVGEKLNLGEEITVRISRNSNSLFVSSITAVNSTFVEISFDPSVSLGQAVIYVARKRVSEPIETTSAGGSVIAEYQSASLAFEIIE